MGRRRVPALSAEINSTIRDAIAQHLRTGALDERLSSAAVYARIARTCGYTEASCWRTNTVGASCASAYNARNQRPPHALARATHPPLGQSLQCSVRFFLICATCVLCRQAARFASTGRCAKYSEVLRGRKSHCLVFGHFWLRRLQPSYLDKMRRFHKTFEALLLHNLSA